MSASVQPSGGTIAAQPSTGLAPYRCPCGASTPYETAMSTVVCQKVTNGNQWMAEVSDGGSDLRGQVAASGGPPHDGITTQSAAFPAGGLIPLSHAPLPRVRRFSLRRPVTTATALVTTVVVLVITNIANNRWAHGWSLAVSLVVTGVLLAIVYWAGGGWGDVGLARETLGRGLRWAPALIGIVAAVYVCGAVLPFTRDLFADQRTSSLSAAEVALRILVTVPLGTVLLEEVAFRGVLYGLVLRVRGPLPATLFSSGLFGLWHILPSRGLAGARPALGGVFGDSVLGVVLVDAGAVLFTAAAGCLLCELRRRSGSLLAPMGLHWATNALGYLFSFLLR